MNTKTTVILALVCAAVFAYLVLVEKPWQVETAIDEPAVAERGVPLFEPRPEPASVDRVEIREDDGREFVFVRDEQRDWNLTAPLEARASKFEVDAFVNAICDIRQVQVYEPRDRGRPSAATTGLDAPMASVRLLAGDEAVVDLSVGARVPTGSGNYLSLADDERIFVSRDTLNNHFRKRLSDYRDKRVLDFQLANATRVTVEGVRHFEFVRQDAESWMIEAPFRGPADKSKVESVVRPLTYLRADTFIDEEPLSPRLYGLDSPQLKVTVETERTITPRAVPDDPDAEPAETEPQVEKKSYVLMIGSAADVRGERYFARLDGQASIFTVRQDTFNSLTPQVTDLFAHYLVTVEPANVRKIEVTNENGEMTLVKDDQGVWRFDEDATPADDAMVANLIQAVSDLSASEYIDPATTFVVLDWQRPRARVSLTQEGQLGAATVLVGPTSAGGQMAYVRNEAAEAVAAVRAESVTPLLDGPIAYKGRRIFSFDPRSASQIEILRTGAEPVRVRRTEQEWQMIAPVDATADEENVRFVLQNLATLTAQRVVGTGNLADYGLDDPEVSVAVTTLTMPEPQEPVASPEPAAVDDADGADEADEADETDNNGNGNDDADEAGEVDAPADDATPTVEPQVTWYILNLNRHGGALYAAVAGEQTVYELDRQTYGDLTAEMHERTLIRHLAGRVVEAAFSVDGETMTLRKIGDEQWRYEEDPLVPIDSQKVRDILRAFQGLDTHRFVDYEAENLEAYDLGDDADRVRLDLQDGTRYEILLSRRGPADDPHQSRFATLAGTQKVFLLTGEQTVKFAQRLVDVEQSVD